MGNRQGQNTEALISNALKIQDDAKHECRALTSRIQANNAPPTAATEGANGTGAEPQPQPRIPTDNANVFIKVLQSLQHS